MVECLRFQPEFMKLNMQSTYPTAKNTHRLVSALLKMNKKTCFSHWLLLKSQVRMRDWL